MNDYQAGIRATNLTSKFSRIEIGIRAICEYEKDNSLKNEILSFVYLCESVVEFFILLFISPFVIGYLIYRMGFKKTIKLFKRIDKNIKNKQKSRF